MKSFRFIVILLGSWCVMTLSHELGHLFGGWCCGAKLQQVELRPWRLPYSIFQPDPHPLITLWAGPILGAVFPLVFAAFIRRDWAWFIASFCVLANGVYLSVAWYSGDSQLDTTKLLQGGASPLSVLLFCLVTVIYGYTAFRKDCQRVWRSDQVGLNRGRVATEVTENTE